MRSPLSEGYCGDEVLSMLLPRETNFAHLTFGVQHLGCSGPGYDPIRLKARPVPGSWTQLTKRRTKVFDSQPVPEAISI